MKLTRFIFYIFISGRFSFVRCVNLSEEFIRLSNYKGSSGQLTKEKLDQLAKSHPAQKSDSGLQVTDASSLPKVTQVTQNGPTAERGQTQDTATGVGVGTASTGGPSGGDSAQRNGDSTDLRTQATTESLQTTDPPKTTPPSPTLTDNPGPKQTGENPTTQAPGPQPTNEGTEARGDTLPSTTTQNAITQLVGSAGPGQDTSADAPPPPAPERPVTGNALTGRTTEATIKPVATPPTNAAATATPKPAVTTTTAGENAGAEGNVRGVLLTSLREVQRAMNSANTNELAKKPGNKPDPSKKLYCQALKASNTNVCQTNNMNQATDLLPLVNDYYRNNVCLAENSMNQFYNRDGDFSYKLLNSHLAQFKKKAPNKATQDVYDKSVPVVTKLAELMKKAELALVGEKVEKLLEKRYTIISAALCGVATNVPEVMSSAEFNEGQVTLTVNEEDFINETTNTFMKAYSPMADLLKEFNVLLPKLLDLFEEGFENKVNLLTSLANVVPAAGQGGNKAPEAPAEKTPAVPAPPEGPPSSAGSGTSPPQQAAAAPGPDAKAAQAGPAAGGPSAKPGTSPPTLLQFFSKSGEEVAAVHGHPSLIQKVRSLLQISSNLLSSTEPAPTTPKEPAPTAPKEPAPTTQENQAQTQTLNSAQPGVGSGQPGPEGVKTVPTLEVLDRVTAGGVSAPSNSGQRLATSSQSDLPAPSGSSTPLDPPAPATGVRALIGNIKNKLQLLISRRPGDPNGANSLALKLKRNNEKEEKLLAEAMRHFKDLGLFKTKNGKLVPELDEQKVKTLVRTNLLSLSDYDSLYNLVIGPQRALHSLYTFLEHLLLSPDADEKIATLNDPKLLTQIKKMVDPLEDLYEQIKAKAPKLVLKAPNLGAEAEGEEAAEPQNEEAGAHHNLRPGFVLVSNSSGVKLSEDHLLAKTNGANSPQLRSGFKGTLASTRLVMLASVLVVLKFL